MVLKVEGEISDEEEIWKMKMCFFYSRIHTYVLIYIFNLKNNSIMYSMI